MSRPTRFVSGLLAVSQLEALRLARSKHIVVTSIAVALAAVGAAVVGHGFEFDPASIYQSIVSAGYFGLLVYLLPFLFAAGAVSEEVEGRTLPFLVTRPVRRWVTLAGKFLVASITATGLLWCSLLAFHIAVFAPGGTEIFSRLPTTLQHAGALSILLWAYCAICMFWGSAVVGASGIACTMYLAIIEFGVGTVMPGPGRLISLNTHARSLGNLPESGLFASETTPALPWWGSALTITVVGVAFACLAALVFERREYATDRA